LSADTIITAPPLQRQPGWETRLLDEVQRASDEPFRWGSHDCVQFAARCVHAVTGQRVALPGRWRSPSSAAGAVQAAGGFEHALDTRFGPRVLPTQAQRGDLGLVATIHGATGHAVAVCVGAWFVAPGQHGLQRFGAGDVLQAWRVG
jgi:hypothetical protein